MAVGPRGLICRMLMSYGPVDFFFCVLEGFGGLCCCDVNWCGGRFGCVSA